MHNCKGVTIGLLLAAGLIFCWGIWSVPILGHNEARRMVVVQEMLAHGNWLLPTMNGEVYLAKPPLLYWLMAASCTLFHSQAEWAMRLPSTLMAFLLLALTLKQGARYLGQGPALFAATMLATSEAYIEFARSAQIEMLQALTCTVAVFCFLDFLQSGKRLRLYLAYAALGAAILSKGPVVLIFFIPPAILFGVVSKERAVLRGLTSIPGWAIALLIALPWFIYILVAHKPLIDHVINEDIADKVAGVSKHSPLYTYPLFLLGAFAPWFLTLCSRPRQQWQKMVSGYEQRYFLIFALLPLLLMSLVAEKHGKYLLPLFPSLALVLGSWCHAFYAGAVQKFPNRAPKWLFTGAGLLLAGHFLFQGVLTPRIYAYRFSALQPMAAAIQRLAGKRPVYALNEAPIQLVYYAQRPMPVKNSQEVMAMGQAREDFLLVASSKGGQELATAPFCLLAEFSPFLKKNRSAKLLGSGDLCLAPSGHGEAVRP
jgi:4-amino-4-deoxy-L-arabinose transferase-like glycosyltransferase